MDALTLYIDSSSSSPYATSSFVALEEKGQPCSLVEWQDHPRRPYVPC